MLGWFRRKERHLPPWRTCRLFDGLTSSELEAVEGWLTRRNVGAGETLVVEGEAAKDLLLLTAGRAEILRAGPHRRNQRIGVVEAGEVIGELALFDRLPRSATVRLVEDGEVWTLPFQKLRPGGAAAHSGPLADAYAKLVVNMAGGLSAKLRAQSDESLATAHRREVMGSFLVSVLVLLCGYVFFLEGVERLDQWMPADTTLVSIPLQVIFGVASWSFIRGTGYPLHQFGIGLKSLPSSLAEAIVLTVPVLAALTGLKWVLIHTVGTGSGPLIEHPDIAVHLAAPKVAQKALVYCVSSAVQELIARGALQSSLEMFIARSTSRRDAVLVTALLFSVMHLHMSFLFAALALLPGLFWGWLFARRKNLAGVTLSHIVVGGYVFFVMGVNL